MTRGKRIIVAAAVGAVLIAIGFAAFAPKAVVVEMQSVSRGLVRVAIEEEGQTRVRERYVVSAPVAGRLQRIVCAEGDAVHRGTVLGRLYPLPLDYRSQQQSRAHLQAVQAAHEEALARLAQAQTTWAEQKKELARAETLAGKQLLPPVELDRAREAERVAEMEVQAATSRTDAALHEVENARAALLGAAPGTNIRPLAITAPVDGTVLRVYEECERAVTVGAPIVEIGDLTDVEIIVDVLSSDAPRIEPGARMLFFVDQTRNDTSVATVRRVEPSAFTKISPLGIEEQRVRVIADPLRSQRLGDRYRLDAEIILWEADVVRVPTGALFRNGDAWAVFVVQRGRARSRNVQIGHRSALFAEVLGGVRRGEHIIIHPPATLHDGTRVTSERDSST